MGSSIPASAIVNVSPSVIDAGGTGLDLGGLIFTNDTRVPIGTVASFTNAALVAAFFGAVSVEARLASVYFAGFDNSSVKPAKLLFAQYASAGVSPYLRGANVSALSLSQLRAISGTVSLDIDGQAITSGAINLSAVTSFSNAATVIQTALGHNAAAVTGAISGTTLTVSAVASGALAVGQVIAGSGVTAGTKIIALGTGTGGTGTYTVDTAQTVASGSLTAGQTTVTFDSTSGAFVVHGGTASGSGTITVADTSAAATALGLTAATGAVTSQGSDAMTPAGVMASVTACTQNFATFMTAFKPSVADMTAFAAWTNGQLNRWAYVMWDDDVTVTTSNNTASAGYAIEAARYSGTIPVYAPVNQAAMAAFIMGAVAAIDFNRANDRTNLAFRAQAGLLPDVTDRSIADQLEANGYNYYGAWATANDEFVFLRPGQVSGPFLYVDSYVNQIWMNNQFQLALMTLLTSVKSIPYNPVGYALIDHALADPINAAVSFGAIHSGAELSALQIAQVNNAAGRVVSDTIAQRGWYLLVAPASSQVRAARGSPPVTFWYYDGQSVQSINLNSVEII